METVVLEMAIEQQYNRLLKGALHILNHRYDAEDAVQSACLKAWLRFPHTSIRVCEAWLKVIVYRECITIIRKRSRYRLPIDIDTTGILYDAEERIVEYMERQRLHALVESLPTRYSLIVKMRYYEGRSVEEIAQELHNPASTIRSRLSRAYKILHNRYCEAN